MGINLLEPITHIHTHTYTEFFDIMMTSAQRAAAVKSGLGICLLVLEILNKQTFFPFFETPCI